MAVRKVLALTALVIVLVGGAAALVGWLAWNGMHRPYKGYTGPEQFVVERQAQRLDGASQMPRSSATRASSAPRSGGPVRDAVLRPESTGSIVR
jgi:hypothetical protein